MYKLFITGTDTNCGKTYATCKLINYLNANKITTHAIKPVASGCTEQDEHLFNEDEILLQLEQNNLGEITPWKYKSPVSPHIAALRENQFIDICKVIDFCNNFHNQHKFKTLLIEGAGGLLVPLNEKQTWLDFLIQSRIPVVLVIGMRLGCINHSLLTEAVLKNSAIETFGWIANCIDPDMLELEANIETLKNKLKTPFLGKIDYLKDFVPSDFMRQFQI